MTLPRMRTGAWLGFDRAPECASTSGTACHSSSSTGSNRFPYKPEPVEDEVWTRYASSEDEPYLFVFECSGELFGVTGSVSAEVNVNKMSTKDRETFAETKNKETGWGEQDLLLNGLPAVLETVSKTINEEKVEIKACNEIGAKPEGKGQELCPSETPAS
jgi:hypothetical protein